MKLPADKGETCPELDEEFAEMFDQPEFQFAFPRIDAQCEKSEVAGIFDQLLREIGLRIGKGLLEVRYGFTLPVVQFGLDLHGKDVPTPPVLGALLCIPEADGRILNFLDDNDVVEPWNGQDFRRR
jgi:hypothetical protein